MEKIFVSINKDDLFNLTSEEIVKFRDFIAMELKKFYPDHEHDISYGRGRFVSTTDVDIMKDLEFLSDHWLDKFSKTL